jgi:simple sugar transport system ATP-binding protein
VSTSNKEGTRLKSVNLKVRAGEICGIAGVAGNGQRELTRVVTGLLPVKSGMVSVWGRSFRGQGIRDFIAAGVSHIPEDRLDEGLAPGLSVIDNCMLKNYKKFPISKWMVINSSAARNQAETLVNSLKIKAEDLEAPVGLLSGGNLQRLLIAREVMLHQPKLLVAVHPTRGLDIAGVQLVHSILFDLSSKGTAVLLISEDLDELMEVCDTVAVMFNGELSGQRARKGLTREEIGIKMGGA